MTRVDLLRVIIDTVARSKFSTRILVPTVCSAILAPFGDTVQSIFFVFPKPSKTVNSLYVDQTPVPINLPILNPAF